MLQKDKVTHCDCAVDDVSSVSEVSENETDDDSEPMSTNTCSDCRSTSQSLLFQSLFDAIVVMHSCKRFFKIFL